MNPQFSDSKLLMKTSTLLLLFVILALNGFVCTHKIQAEDECQSSNVQCYECDSRTDPNCADPFDFSPLASLDAHLSSRANLDQTNLNQSKYSDDIIDRLLVTDSSLKLNASSSNEHQALNSNRFASDEIALRHPKKLPHSTTCHGCCVKITTKTLDGGTYVKRTCTTNIHINFFMVGLVCMKESGDRGKMCFCETDYCNGQTSIRLHSSRSTTLILITALLMLLVFSRFLT